MMTDANYSRWDNLQWRRHFETFGDDDSYTLKSGPNGEVDAIW